MQSSSLTELADQQIAEACAASSGRSARTIHGGHDHALRQTLIALAAGHGLDEHESPGEATLQVLRGQVRLSAGEQTWDGGPGDFVAIPPRRHALMALEDGAVLLTVAVTARP